MTSPILAEATGGSAVDVSSFDLPVVNPGGDSIVLLATITVRPIRTITLAGWDLVETRDFAAGNDRFSIFRKEIPAYAGPYSDTVTLSGPAKYAAAQLAFRSTGSQPTNSDIQESTYACTTNPTRSATLPSGPTSGNIVLAFGISNGCGPSGYSYSGAQDFGYSAGWIDLDLLAVAASFPRMGIAYRLADGTPGEDSVTATWHSDNTREMTAAIVELAIEEEPTPVDPPDALGWDVYAADDPNGAILATLDDDAFDRLYRIELNGTGSGRFRINRSSALATAAVIAKGNIVKVRNAAQGEDYVFAFILEQGDFDLLSSDEEGGEILEFGGRGILGYLDRAIMWNEAFSTGLDTSPTWSKIWSTTNVPKPSGIAYDSAQSAYVFVISETTRRIYKVRQSDRKVVATSAALFSHPAAGLSGDPSDSTIWWVLEAPWLYGSSAHTKIHKVRKSDYAILATFNLGSAIKHTDIRASSGHLWLSRYDGATSIYKRSKTTGGVVDSYSVSYGGVTQTKANGISVNGTELAYWYQGTKRALLATTGSPTTITGKISTSDIASFGGEWTTEGADDFFYMVSYVLGRTWKYQITLSTPRDPIDGIWRLDEATPGAILWRLMQEWQHASRPQDPLPDVAYDFTSTVDSNGAAWSSHAGTTEFDASVGDKGTGVVLRLPPYGIVVQMSPTLELVAVNSFGTNRTSATYASGKVRFVGGDNVAANLKRRLDSRELDSHVLAQGDGKLFATATQDDLGYVVEGFVSTEQKSAAALEGTAEAVLDQQREDNEAVAFEAAWGPGGAGGADGYIPGPAGSLGHYWIGDTVRLHTGTDPLDYNEESLRVYAITVEETDAGEWKAYPELGSELLVGDSVSSGGSSSSSGSSIGGGGGGGGGAPAGITLEDEIEDVSFVATTLRSEEHAYVEEEDRVGLVAHRWPELGSLANVDVAGISNGATIVYDASSGMFVASSSGGGVAVLIADLSNPPTQAEIVGAIGEPASSSPGEVYQLVDSDTDRTYLVASIGGAYVLLPTAQTSGNGTTLVASAGIFNDFHGRVAAAAYDATSGKTFWTYMTGAGDVCVRSYDHATATASAATTMRAALDPGDLHSQPGLLIRSSDRKILVFYAPHAGTPLYLWTSTSAADISAGSETNLHGSVAGTDYTYPVPIELPDGIYLFLRTYTGSVPGGTFNHAGAIWSYSKSTDDGATWSAKVQIMSDATYGMYWMPSKTADDRVDFLACDRSTFDATGGSLFHFYMIAGEGFFETDGTAIVATLPFDETALTLAWASDGTQRTDPGQVILGPDGYPRALFHEFESISPEDGRYLWARWDGDEWTDAVELAGAGSGAPRATVVFANGDPFTVYYTKDVGAVSQVFRATTIDDGATWSHRQITDAAEDQSRVVMVRSGLPELPVIWLDGYVDDVTDADFSGGSFAPSAAQGAQPIVVLDGDAFGDGLVEAIWRRGTDGLWYVSRDLGATWEPLASGANPAAGLLTVDPGTPSYNLAGDDLVVTLAADWGYDADGPYYDDTGAATGEEAILAIDPSSGLLTVVPYHP